MRTDRIRASQLAEVMYDTVPYQKGVLVLDNHGIVLEAKLTDKLKQKGLQWQNRFFEDLEFLINLFHSMNCLEENGEEVLNINEELVSIKVLDENQILVVVLDKRISSS